MCTDLALRCLLGPPHEDHHQGEPPTKRRKASQVAEETPGGGGGAASGTPGGGAAAAETPGGGGGAAPGTLGGAAGPPSAGQDCIPGALQGLVVALCCHHRCQWRHYVGQSFFRQRGLGAAEFSAFCRMSSWATCGLRAQVAESTSGQEDAANQRQEEEEEEEHDVAEMPEVVSRYDISHSLTLKQAHKAATLSTIFNVVIK